MKFRKLDPKRTFKDVYGSTHCKKNIMQDFNNRCGYCDIGSVGAIDSFHVDHFAPHKKFSSLAKVNAYKNLVYSCPSCNLSKLSYWPTNKFNQSMTTSEGFYDPCDPKYAKVFSRTKYGDIVASDTISLFMWKRLKFYRMKYAIRWQMSQLKDSISYLQSKDPTYPELTEMKAIYFDLLQSLMNNE